MLLTICIVSSACRGDRGKAGDEGGPGPAGPISAPPALASLNPPYGSSRTHVAIAGTNFSLTLSENRVLFDGHPATVLSATTTELVVRPDSPPVSEEQPQVVSVIVANQVSNGLAFEQVPSGTAREWRVPLPTAPTSAVTVGDALFIAAPSGLFRRNSAGLTTRVLAAAAVEAMAPGGGSTMTVSDGPLALATDGASVFFTTYLGSVRRYDPSTGSVDELVAHAWTGSEPAFPPRTGIVFGSGSLFVVDRTIPQGGSQFGGIVVLELATGTPALITSALFDGGGAPGIFGVTSDGTDLWVTNEAFGEVQRVADPLGAATVGVVADGAARERCHPFHSVKTTLLPWTHSRRSA